MSRFASADGKPRIHILTTLADMAAPSLTEIGNGTDLSLFLAKDGFSSGEAGSRVPISSAAEKVNLEVSGSVSYTVAMTFFRDDDTDTAWDAFTTGNEVYVVFARKGGSGTAGAIADGDEVEVYFGEVLDKSNADIAENTASRFTVNLSTSAAPELDAVVGDSSSS